jgi:hypothetical protein
MLAVPPFTATLQLFGVLPVHLGLTLSETSPLEGSVTGASAAANELLSIPASLNLGVGSVGLLGLTIPTRCATSAPLSFALSDSLSREELLTKGWSFAGTASLPNFRCEGGFLGELFGRVLSALLSGSENPYAITIKAPSG